MDISDRLQIDDRVEVLKSSQHQQDHHWHIIIQARQYIYYTAHSTPPAGGSDEDRVRCSPQFPILNINAMLIALS